jgi:hypothetical protein
MGIFAPVARPNAHKIVGIMRPELASGLRELQILLLLCPSYQKP